MTSHLKLYQRTRLMVALALAAVMACPTGSAAQVTTNITSSGLGTALNGSTTIPCVGGTCDITGGNRPGGGSNLFHSFGLFNVGEGDVANFLNDSGLPTSNIIGRVTGGTSSSIFGTIRTTDFGSANLYLINPSGWIFGATASLDVRGGFYVSTADYVRFSDGAKFYADLAQNSALTYAAPAAFGFLDTHPPAKISVQGAFLQVDPGQTLSLVGGDVDVTEGAALIAPGGVVQIGSVASAGEAGLFALDGTPALDLGSFSRLGKVEISGGGGISVSGPDIGLPGGRVVIRSGQLIVDGAVIVNDTGDLAGTPVVGIDLGATDSIDLKNGALVQTTSGAADASGISMATGKLSVTDSAIESTAIDGRTGAIDIQVGSADLLNGVIRTSSVANGAGDINIGASGTVMLSGPTSTISTETFSSDPAVFAGNISLSAAKVILADQATIRNGGLLGQGGETLRVTATDSIMISGLAGISSQSFSADVGLVDISAPRLIMDAGFINTSTLGSGNAGQVLATVGTASLKNGAQIASSSQGAASGAGGNITINASGAVTISGVGPADGVGSITFTNDPSSGIFSTASGTGVGGDSIINAGQLVNLNNGGKLSAQSTGTATATAGNITINTPTFQSQGGIVTTGATLADGGNISINTTGSLVHLTNSQITTSVESGVGGGGNITINSSLVVLDNSQVFANAFGGPGGNINITADVFLVNSGGIVPTSLAGIVSASSALSTPGIIDIQASVTDVSGSVAQLPAAPLQATELLRAACAARFAGGKASSLVLAGRDGVPLQPGSVLPSPLYVAGLSTDTRVTAQDLPLRFTLLESKDRYLNRFSLLPNVRCSL
jgi:filamentous hemagglutinin family protein